MNQYNAARRIIVTSILLVCGAFLVGLHTNEGIALAICFAFTGGLGLGVACCQDLTDLLGGE